MARNAYFNFFVCFFFLLCITFLTNQHMYNNKVQVGTLAKVDYYPPYVCVWKQNVSLTLSCVHRWCFPLYLKSLFLLEILVCYQQSRPCRSSSLDVKSSQDFNCKHKCFLIILSSCEHQTWKPAIRQSVAKPHYLVQPHLGLICPTFGICAKLWSCFLVSSLLIS